MEHARAEHTPIRVVDGLWVQARALLWRGSFIEAAAALDEALALARRLPYALGILRVLETAADLHAGLGVPILAQTYEDEARACRERLGGVHGRVRLQEHATALSHNPARPSQNYLRASQNPADLSQNSPGASQNSLGPSQNDLATQVTDAQWARIAALLPPRAGTGRPRADDRRTLEAILHARRTGCAWSALPHAPGDGKTAHRRWREWQAGGLWERIAGILAEGEVTG